MRDDVSVTTQRTGAGDPAHTLRLLWREPTIVSRRGPRQSLDLDNVVDTAIRLADAHGLDALTMRQVADALGVAPMTLYTYVPGKAELLDLMLDAAYAAMDRADTSGQPWPDRLTAIAEENRALFVAHPWAAAVSTIRPPLGPGQMAKYEHELRALDGLGLDDVEMDDILTYLLGFVQANARAAADSPANAADSSLNDAEWWAANAPLLAKVFDESAYPTAARVGAAAGAAHASTYNPEHAYRFGLDRVIAGIDPLIGSTHRRPSRD
jgi:AcrR family transcriptional regulator